MPSNAGSTENDYHTKVNQSTLSVARSAACRQVRDRVTSRIADTQLKNILFQKFVVQCFQSLHFIILLR